MQAGLWLLRRAAIVVMFLGAIVVGGPAARTSAADATKSFVPVTPARLMDTREGLGGVRLLSGEMRVMHVAGRDPVPSSGAVCLTDDYSGVDRAFIQFFNAAGQVRVAPIYDSGLQSGTAKDGIYTGTLTMPRYAATGTWHVDSVTVHDKAGNGGSQIRSELAARGLSWSFEQVGPGDTTAPALQELSWTPITVNTAAAAQQITVTAKFSDELAGLVDTSSAVVAFSSPSGHQYLPLYLSRVAGTAQDGTYTGVLTVPALSESGVWTGGVTVWDALGNNRFYSSVDLAARGLPTTFTNN